MRRSRTRGFAVFMALALTAVLGASAASASAAEFAAEKYPVLFDGIRNSSPHLLSTKGGTVTCQTADLAGQAEGASGTMTMTPSFGCTVNGVSTDVKMNGCRFEFHPGTEEAKGRFNGTLDIGPAGCGPIEITLGTLCQETISPQSAAASVSYTNLGSGSGRHIEVGMSVTNLKYTLNGNCSGLGGKSYSDGQYTGSWDVEGSVPGTETPRGIYVAGAAAGPHQPRFEANSYPSSITGAQDAANKHLGVFAGGNYKCTNVALYGGLESASTSLALAPVYTGCTLAGAAATVKANGCQQVGQLLNAVPYVGQVNLTCPGAAKLEIASPTCTVAIPGQANVGTASYTNTEESQGLSMSVSLSGISYTQIGTKCLGNGGAKEKSFTNGTYTGGSILSGDNAVFITGEKI